MQKFQVQPSARRENRIRRSLAQKLLFRTGKRHLVAGAGAQRRKHLHIAFNPRTTLERELLGHRRIDVHPQRQLRQHQIPDGQRNRQSDLSGGDRTATLARFGVVRRETHHERYAFARRQRNRGRKTDDLFRICEIFLGDVRRRLGICGKERIRSIHGRISLDRPEPSAIYTHHSAYTEFSGHVTVESVNGQLHLLRRTTCVHHRKVARLRFVAGHCQFNGFLSARSGIFRHADGKSFCRIMFYLRLRNRPYLNPAVAPIRIGACAFYAKRLHVLRILRGHLAIAPDQHFVKFRDSAARSYRNAKMSSL